MTTATFRGSDLKTTTHNSHEKCNNVKARALLYPKLTNAHEEIIEIKLKNSVKYDATHDIGNKSSVDPCSHRCFGNKFGCVPRPNESKQAPQNSGWVDLRKIESTFCNNAMGHSASCGDNMKKMELNSDLMLNDFVWKHEDMLQFCSKKL